MAVNSPFFLDAANLTLATTVYLDLALTHVAPDGFYSDGTISRQQSSGILLDPSNCACSFELSIRSTVGSSTYSESLCSTLGLGHYVYISTSTSPVITTGDRAFNTNNESSPFNGADKYYLLQLGSAISGYIYICKIDTHGYITVMFNCPTYI